MHDHKKTQIKVRIGSHPVVLKTNNACTVSFLRPELPKASSARDVNFLFSFDIFKTTSRMTVLFLLLESPDSEEYFTYQVHAYEIYCDLSAAQRS